MNRAITTIPVLGAAASEFALAVAIVVFVFFGFPLWIAAGIATYKKIGAAAPLVGRFIAATAAGVAGALLLRLGSDDPQLEHPMSQSTATLLGVLIGAAMFFLLGAKRKMDEAEEARRAAQRAQREAATEKEREEWFKERYPELAEEIRQAKKNEGPSSPT